MQVEQWPIDKLIPFHNNSRVHDEKNLKAISASVDRFSWLQPIVVDKEGVIIMGHGRREAALQLGMTEVPVLVADWLTENEAAAAREADNMTQDLSFFDMDLLNANLGEIDWLDIDMTEFGFKLDDELFGEAEEDDYTEEDAQEAPSRAQRGDIWQLGTHRLMCGDSTSETDVESLMGGGKADMVLSDPPYGMHLDTDFSGCIGSIGRKNHTQGNKYDRVIGDNDDFEPELITTFFDNFSYCKEMFLFGADYYAEILPNKNGGSWLVWDKRKESQAYAIGSEFELIWSRNKHKRRMLRFDWFGFLSSTDGADARNRVHPTQKPVSLLCEIINQWGKDATHIVDLFGGSGSTLIACEQLGRKCYMMELDPHYCDVIIDRWESLTGKEARKLG